MQLSLWQRIPTMTKHHCESRRTCHIQAYSSRAETSDSITYRSFDDGGTCLGHSTRHNGAGASEDEGPCRRGHLPFPIESRTDREGLREHDKLIVV